jgi:hypothetical protein
VNVAFKSIFATRKNTVFCRVFYPIFSCTKSPVSSQVHKSDIAEIYNRKKTHHKEGTIYPFLQLTDRDAELMAKELNINEGNIRRDKKAARIIFIDFKGPPKIGGYFIREDFQEKIKG